MDNLIRLVGPEHAVEFLGIRLVGVNAANGTKLLLSLAFIAIVLVLGALLRRLAQRRPRGRDDVRAQFWIDQGIKVATAVLLILGVFSVWFDDPARLTTALGLVTAGLAFALQKVVTALAGYFVILRGRTFNVGDRIVMGGVRGDVITVDFTQTTIMEMGQPPPVQGADPAVWVQSREYTGRVVTVTNAKLFDEPVYNYSRDFPYLWEEMRLPIAYTADRQRAERILLDAADRHTLKISDLGREALDEMQRRYVLLPADMQPKVYYRLTDNWLELTVRFIVRDHGIRALKDAMSRDILQALDQAGIGLASATFEIVGLPPLRIANAIRNSEGGLDQES
ncbi:MAG: mechanosensitive ion channel family protein [Acidobacteria bacterium]|nr:mechanosensitive ion channel family protein [Acidobacteriota bacterium]